MSCRTIAGTGTAGGRVLDYIGVEWRDPEVALINAAEQITMDEVIRYLAAKAAE